LLGFVAFRWDMPMTFRIAFYPLLGDVVHGLFGDFVDFVSTACTTFGVCTSLGFGVDIILAGLRSTLPPSPFHRLSSFFCCCWGAYVRSRSFHHHNHLFPLLVVV